MNIYKDSSVHIISR